MLRVSKPLSIYFYLTALLDDAGENSAWVAIYNPSKQTCTDQGCKGIVKWDDEREISTGKYIRYWALRILAIVFRLYPQFILAILLNFLGG